MANDQEATKSKEPACSDNLRYAPEVLACVPPNPSPFDQYVASEHPDRVLVWHPTDQRWFVYGELISLEGAGRPADQVVPAVGVVALSVRDVT